MGAIFLVIASLVFVGYVLLAVYSTTWVQNRFASKWPARLTILFWVLLPTWDSILALGYHRYVCMIDPEVGVTVYHMVKLDPKYFGANGNPQIFDRYGNIDEGLFGKRFRSDWKDYISGHPPLGVFTRTIILSDTQTGTKLSMFKTHYAAGGLWWWNIFFGRLGGPGGGSECPKTDNLSVTEVFKRPFVANAREEN